MSVAYELDTWYDALVKDNTAIGGAFTIGEYCYFRYLGKDEFEGSIFEIFDLKNTSKTITPLVAKAMLSAKRTTRGELYRSHDQGFINWRYSCMDKGLTHLYEPNFTSFEIETHSIVGDNPKSYIVKGGRRTRILKIEIGSRFFPSKDRAKTAMISEVQKEIESSKCRLERLEKIKAEYLKGGVV